MALLNVDLSVTQGEDWNDSWIWASPDPSGQGDLFAQVYYNFAGAHARMVVRTEQDPASLSVLGLTDGSGIAFAALQAQGGPPAPSSGAPNAFSVTIAKALSLGIAFGEYFYDLFIDWANGTSTCFLQGQFVVVPSVTR